MSKEKQIEEMAKAIDQAKYDMWVGKAHQSGDFTNHSKNIAKYLFGAGYRKQSKGEWKYDFTLDGDDFYKCSVCDRQEVVNGLCAERNPAIHYPYCHCGAKMKGGEQG